MKSCIFLGPTLRIEPSMYDREKMSIFGPARLGSVYRAAEAGFQRLGIVDGYFGNVAPVWHKEILWAMSRGVEVLGAASIGALRAAELAHYGMRGIGMAYRLYANRILSDDDEVCVAHAPKDMYYRQLSVPMLNIRVTLRRMRRKRMISLEQERLLINVAKQLHFSNRRLEEIHSHARDLDPALPSQTFRQDFAATYVDVKARDCLHLIRLLCDPITPEPPHRAWEFPSTCFWQTQFVDRLDELPGLDEP